MTACIVHHDLRASPIGLGKREFGEYGFDYEISTRPDGRQRNLVLVVRKGCRYMVGDFRQIADHIRELAPDVRPLVISDRLYHALRPSLAWRPTVVVCPRAIRHFRSVRGSVFQGQMLRKSQECEILARHQIPVPRWAVVTQNHMPSLEDFGMYVVSKPDLGGKGAEVKIKRKTRVRWKPPQYVRHASCTDQLVQEFIYTGRWPASYRVATFFDKVLYAWRVQASFNRRPLNGPDQWREGETGGGMSIVSSGAGCTFELIDDADIIALAERAHAAFPSHPLLGVDIVREEPTGKLYVLEVNACGHVWHFSSNTGVGIQRSAGFDLRAQFDGLRKAAKILIDQTRRAAS